MQSYYGQMNSMFVEQKKVIARVVMVLLNLI